MKINHSLNQINAKKKKHPKFGVLKIKSMRKVIYVRSFLNLLSELSLVNQYLKLGKAELRRKVQPCRYKIFLIIYPNMKILFEKSCRFGSNLFPSASCLSDIHQYQKGKVSWGQGWLRSLTFTQKLECTLFYR